MTENMDNARPSISRRSLVVSAGLLTSLGLFGCNKRRGNSSIPEVMTKDEEWQSAYDEAVECWETLQSDMTGASDYLTQLQGQRVKNPDTLTALQEAVDSANSLEDKVSDLSAPKDAKKLESSIDKLKKIAASYRDASSAIVDARSAIEVIQPGQGAFDFMDEDGYTYHIEYNVNPEITVDSSEGKPGYVGLHFDFSNSSVTVKNITSGKKAPGLYLSLLPLYAVGDFCIDVSEMYYGNVYGPYDNPFDIAAYKKDFYAVDTNHQLLYVNPFDLTSSDLPNVGLPWGERVSTDFSAAQLVNRYGTDKLEDGGEYEPDETRNLICTASPYYGSPARGTLVGTVLESSAEVFKRPVAWCVWPLNTDAQGTAVFCAGKPITYNPVA